MIRVECVCEGICHLGECPVWDPVRQKLFWTDIYRKQVWAHDPALSSSSVFWQGSYQVGGLAVTRQGSLVLCTDKGVYLLELGVDGIPKQEPLLLCSLPFSGGEMFNDITTDSEGRILAGTLERKHFTGSLYRLERGKPPAKMLEGIRCSNGMTFSMDESWFFHTESLTHRITKYRYDRATGEIGSPTVYYQGSSREGLPDGITIDVEDHLWVAFWGASCVRRLDPEGRPCEQIPIPARQPSSVMFGGPRLDEIYVTSAAEGAVDLATGHDRTGAFLGGPLYRFSAGVKGRPEWPAAF